MNGEYGPQNLRSGSGPPACNFRTDDCLSTSHLIDMLKITLLISEGLGMVRKILSCFKNNVYYEISKEPQKGWLRYVRSSAWSRSPAGLESTQSSLLKSGISRS